MAKEYIQEIANELISSQCLVENLEWPTILDTQQTLHAQAIKHRSSIFPRDTKALDRFNPDDQLLIQYKFSLENYSSNSQKLAIAHYLVGELLGLTGALSSDLSTLKSSPGDQYFRNSAKTISLKLRVMLLFTEEVVLNWINSEEQTDQSLKQKTADCLPQAIEQINNSQAFFFPEKVIAAKREILESKNEASRGLRSCTIS